MALQVWLPFIGDLHNQGLCNNIVTGNVTFNNSGKLGQCLELSGQYLNLQVPQSIYDVYTVANTEISYSLWVKIDKAYLNNLISTTDFSEKTQIYNRIMGFTSGTTSSGMGFQVYADNLTSSTVLNTLQLDGFLRNGAIAQHSAIVEINLDEWYHLCITYNKTNVLNFYINGVLITSQTVIRDSLNTSITNKILALNVATSTLNSSSAANVHLVQLKEYFNDVRIYDHALSAKEVEEIAKGLVLWYQLNGETQIKVPAEYQQLEYLESTGTQSIDTGIIPTATHQFNFKYALMEFNGYRGPFSAYQGESYKCTRIICNNGSTTGVLIYHTTQAAGTGATPQSANITTATGEVIEGYLNKNGFKLKNLTTNTEVSSSTTFNNSGTASNNTMRLFGSNTIYSKTRIYYFDTYNNGVCIQKLIPAKRLSDNVLGMYDIITHTFFTNASTGTFTAGPNASVIGTAYDSSGYSNNGTISGTLTATAGSPRYSYTTSSTGGTTNGILLNQDLNIATDRKFSFSCWSKCVEQVAGGWNLNIALNSNLRFNFGTSGGGSSEQLYVFYDGTAYTGISFAHLFDDHQWHYYVGVYENQTITFYKDGALLGTSTYQTSYTTTLPYTNLNGSKIVFQKFNGSISDVRIYVTALTAEQVAELYNTSMLVDTNGNVTPRGLGDLI